MTKQLFRILKLTKNCVDFKAEWLNKKKNYIFLFISVITIKYFVFLLINE